MSIDPIIYTIRLGSLQIPIRWYGVLIVTGALVAAWYAAWYIKRWRQNPDIIWDAMVWLLISGIIGARIWYVVADIIGGNTRYLDNPAQIVQIWQGGLNILGGIMLAAVVGWWYAQRNNISVWLLADAVGPGLLIGQAIGRLGNYINQELYGPPTTLPWGIHIDASHRLPPWNDMTQFPFDTTRFHPTFAYEALWNLVMFGIIVYLIIRFGDRIRTGMVAGMWLIASGVGRTWVELFRPDQPKFFGTPISTSMLLSIIFALIGVLILLARSGRLNLSFIGQGETLDELSSSSPPARRPRRVRR